MESVIIVPGLSFPFFPPRPIQGCSLTPKTVSGFLESHQDKYVLQKKLNGDRVVCYIDQGDRVHFLNRHGSLFSYAVSNAPRLRSDLPGNTVIDGEVWKKQFHPFEVVVWGGVSMLSYCPARRVEAARQACKHLGQEFLFDVEDGYLERLRANLPQFEGVVRKRLGSAYIPLGSPTQTTSSWFKNRW